MGEAGVGELAFPNRFVDGEGVIELGEPFVFAIWFSSATRFLTLDTGVGTLRSFVADFRVSSS